MALINCNLENADNPMTYCIRFLLLTLLMMVTLSGELCAQKQSALLLKKASGRNIKVLKHGTTVNIIYIDSQELKRARGPLHIAKNGIVSVSDQIIHPDSIVKMGRWSRDLKTAGIAIMVAGTGITTLGTMVIITGITAGHPIAQIFFLIMGGAVASQGIALMAAGMTILDGGAKVRGKRRVVVQYAP